MLTIRLNFLKIFSVLFMFSKKTFLGDPLFIKMIAVLTLTLTVLLITTLLIKFTYWQRRGLTVPPFACVKDAFTFKESFAQSSYRLYTYLRSKNAQHGGFYMFFRPSYIPIDLNIIKNILQKDFKHFTDHGSYFNEKDDPLSVNLFGMRGNEWQHLRSKLTPTFTANKIKGMFASLLACADDLDRFVARNHEVLNAKDACAKFTIDAVGRSVFGIESNCLKTKDGINEFQRVLGLVLKKTLWSRFKDFMILHAPDLMKFLRVIKIGQEVTGFFLNIVAQTLAFREGNPTAFRNDMIDALMRLRDESARDGRAFAFENMVAQVFVFYVAGYETSSTSLSLALFELSRNVEIQRKLREEVRKVLARYDNVLTFEGIQEMQYLDWVISETLRKYPALHAINRVCTKDYPVPETNLTIKKGTIVLVPVYGIHHDPKFYPEPEKFDPERFSEAVKSTRPACTNLSFGEGPRICIGLRLGLIQIKIGLAALINKYEFSLNKKTDLPIKFEPFTFVTTVKGDIWLNIKKAD